MVPVSLGQKLNFTLLVFMLSIGCATAGLVYFGFQRTQDNATEQSQEGLEQVGQQLMLNIANDQSNLGELSLEWASDAGQIAARYLADVARAGGAFTFDTSLLARTESGILYDPNPNRTTDLAMPNFAPLTPEAIRDMVESAALDAVFPAFLTSYPGRLRQTNFDAIAVFFSSVNQVTRYYPPIGLEKIAPPDRDILPVLEPVGPERNPERRTIWSSPYLDNAGHGMVITAYTPAYFGGAFRGVIGIDLSLARLIDQLNMLRVTPGGFSFYLDQEGELLRTDSYDLLVSELGRGNESLRVAMQDMQRGGTAVTRVTLDGREFFLAHAPLSNVGGSVAVVAPVEEITAQAAAIRDSINEEGNRTILVVLAVVAAFFTAGLAGATWMNRNLLVKPIEALLAGTKAISAGQFNTRITVKGRDEMALLAQSFNQMAADLHQRSRSLEYEIRVRQQAQDELRALFAAMTDTVLMIDKDGNFLRVPTTNAPPVVIAPAELPGKRMHDIMPPAEADELVAVIRRALIERRTIVEERRLMGKDREVWVSSAISPISEDAVVVVARDITDRVNAQQELERRVAERTRELHAILEVSRNLASTLALQPLLQVLLDQLREVADYSRASIFLLEDDSIRLIASQAPGAEVPNEMRITLGTIEPMWQRISSGAAAIIDDVRANTPLAAAYRAGSGGLLSTTFSDIRSWMGVPLSLKDRLIGMVTVSHTRPAAFDERQAELVKAIANQAAVAIENARLYEEAQRRTLELEVLLRADAELFRSLALEEVLQTLVDLTVDLLGMHKSVVAHWGGARDEASIRASRNVQPESVALFAALAQAGMPDVSDYPIAVVHHGRREDAPPALQQILEMEGIESSMEIAIRSPSGQVLGVFAVAFTQHHEFTQDERNLLMALAERAGVAAANAELYARAQQAASLEERQRLARELHDSVSQALYGIALGASTAREILDHDPRSAIEPVEYVLSLAEAGLAEMRALIFELRPESLEIEGLVAAIDKQVAATRARYGLRVEAGLCPEPDLPLRLKEVFYRVTQEALHNIVKHANASLVNVTLKNEDGELALEVRDDGVGFDDTRTYPGHMGLVSMAERATAIGGRLSISSVPGRGTRVRLSVPIESSQPQASEDGAAARSASRRR